MFKTRITDMFGIAAPIVQGSMRYMARAELVAAVSNGGGIGVISARDRGLARIPTQEDNDE